MKKIKCDEIWDYIDGAQRLYRNSRGRDVVKMITDSEFEVYPFHIDWGERLGKPTEMNITRPHDPADDIGKFGVFTDNENEFEDWNYLYGINRSVNGIRYVAPDYTEYDEFEVRMPEPTKTWEKE